MHASDMDLYKKMGRLLRGARKARRLKQGDIADAIGISRPALSNIEAGRQAITVARLMDLMEVYGITKIDRRAFTKTAGH